MKSEIASINSRILQAEIRLCEVIYRNLEIIKSEDKKEINKSGESLRNLFVSIKRANL